MTINLDPEIAAVLAQRAEAMSAAGIILPERGDVMGLRALVDLSLDATFAALPDAPDVEVTPFSTSADDGVEIELRWYTRRGSTSQAAIVYVHGGGMICGTLDNYDRLVRHYVQSTDVSFLAVGYRLAPEHPGTTPATDVYDGLRWVVSRADELGVDVDRIALMGDSGGGGVGAGAAILARDGGLDLAKQILIYPMLDDRNTAEDPHLAPTATWTYDNNFTGWNALLGSAIDGGEVSPIAAPARLNNFAGLAPAYIEVGELDIFRDESIDYAARLLRAGVSCELHVHPGSPHGHDWLDPQSAISQRAFSDRVRVITAL